MTECRADLDMVFEYGPREDVTWLVPPVAVLERMLLVKVLFPVPFMAPMTIEVPRSNGSRYQCGMSCC